MKKRCIRSRAVFCLGSRLGGFMARRDYWTVSELLAHHSLDEILASICDEQMDYATLSALYEQAIKSRTDNDAFVFAQHLNAKYALKVDIDQKILLYCFQDRIRSRNGRVFPWDWPHRISKLGFSNGQSERDVSKDFTQLSFVHFLAKYYWHLPERDYQIRPNEEGIYELIDSPLAIMLDDSHIFLLHTKQNGTQEKWYIADQWWYEHEEILSDCLKISMLEFGDKYSACWRL